MGEGIKDAVPGRPWLAVGAGVLAKGPITPMIVVLTVAGLCLLTRRPGMSMDEFKDYYEVMGVARDATQDEEEH